MRRWHASAIAAVVGVCLGAGVGYVAALLAAGTNTPLISRPAGNSFNQLFLGMGRLESLEIAAANCGGGSDMPSVLKGEAELIPSIKGAAHAQGLNPPMDVADAIRVVRNETAVQKVAKQQVQSQEEAQAQTLLEGVGWGEESASRIRETVARLDENECRQASANGGQAR